MSLHDGNRDVQEVYFCTITCFRWLNLFEESGSYHSVYRWFNHLKTDECHVLGYVIMPNHLHVLLYPTKADKPLSMLVGEGKRFMAYDIVNALKQQGKDSLLAKAKGKLHQVFRLSFDVRNFYPPSTSPASGTLRNLRRPSYIVVLLCEYVNFINVCRYMMAIGMLGKFIFAR